MVFQSVLSHVLNNVLGEFVENLDQNQLNVGIWGGDVELKDLVFKPAALDNLDLPVQCIYGKIGKLVLKIPWKSLYTSRTIITVEDIYLLVHPNQQVKYDEEKEKQRLLDIKYKAIANIAESKKLQKRNSPKKCIYHVVKEEQNIWNLDNCIEITIEPVVMDLGEDTTEESEDDFGNSPVDLQMSTFKISLYNCASGKIQKQGWTADFAEKLVTTIIKNLQLNINNIHIRYEDKVTNPLDPFSIGVTLEELAVESTDANWERALTEDIVKIYKILHLNNLGIYLNSQSTIYADISVQKMLEKLQQEIGTIDQNPVGYRYVLGPIKASVRLKMNQKPELDEPAYSLPKFDANLQMETLFVGLSKNQYLNLIALGDSMSRMERGIPYRKYRPDLNTYIGHSREWWRFAIEAVLEQEVRRKNREWSWKHILAYRNMCKEYKHLFTMKTQKVNLKPEEEDRMKECELTLDITNLIIIREQVELELRRESLSKISWFSSWWPSEESTEETDHHLVNKLRNEMSPEEKKRLYQAIDYHENLPPVDYPEDYVDLVATFLLKSLKFELTDVDRRLNLIQVFKFNLDEVWCKFETRPALQGLTVRISIDDIVGEGFIDDDFTPNLISTGNDKKPHLDILFEINPADKECDQRIHINILPLKLVYDAITINKLMDIFAVPSEALDNLQDAAADRMTEFTEMSALGLQYVVEKQPILDVHIDVQAPYVILPYGGKYTGEENVVVIDLGNLKIYSLRRKTISTDVREQYRLGKNPDEIYKYMLAHSYDVFQLELTNLQILVAQGDEDWKSTLLSTTSTEMHLLHPVTLSISFSKCLITDDPRLPLSKVLAEIPYIKIVASDARMSLGISVGASINWPGSDETPDVRTLDRRYTSTTSINNIVDKYRTEKSRMILPTTVEPIPQDEQQLTTLVATFIIPEILVKLSNQDSFSQPIHDLAVFKIDTLKCDMKQQTYLMNVQLNLGGVELQVKRSGKSINIIETPLLRGPSQQSSLFKVIYTQVDPKCPDFHSVHGSSESSLDVTFAVLKVTLHKEGILSLMQFSSDLQDTLLMTSYDLSQASRMASRSLSRTFSTASRLSVSSKPATTELKTINKSKRLKRKRIVETIKFKVSATLDEVAVKFCTDKRDISNCGISSVEATVIMKDTYMQINATLGDLTIEDLNPESVHNQILSGTEGEALSAQIVMNNLEDFESVIDLPDMDVIVHLGKMRIIFLNWFVTNMLNFLNQFQEAQQAIMEASYAAASAAKENVKEAYEKAQKLALDITLKAPLILVPIDSKSYDVLALDLGIITIQNKFLTLDVINSDGYPAVMEEMIIALKRLKISRAILDPDYEMIEEWHILQPSNLDLSVKRNLSSNWYTGVPDIDVYGQIPVIQIVLSNVDYQGVMHILSGNLAEGVVEDEVPTQSLSAVVQAEATVESIGLTNAEEDKIEMAKEMGKDASKPKSHVFLKFTFLMNKFVISMYYQAGATLKSGLSREKEHNFAKFSLEGLSLKGRISTDDSIVTSVLLLKCTLDDTRPNREDKLNRIIDRSPEKNNKGHTHLTRSMIDVTYQQKKDDVFLDVRIFSFTIVVSLDYLMKLSDFFVVPLETESLHFMVKPSDSMHSTKVVLKPIKEPSDIASKPSTTGQMTLNLKLEKPDIILVEHMDNIDVRAIVFTAEILVKLRQAGTHQVINGVIKDLELYRCMFNPIHRPYTKCVILHPVEISLAGSTPPNQGLHLELLVTSIDMNVSPATIELINQVLASMGDTNDAGSSEEKEYNYIDLWNLKPFNNKDFWFLNIETATDALDTVPEPEEIKMFLQEVCIISVPRITLTVEAGVGNKTLPMVIFETGFRGCVKNWSSLLNMEAGLIVQMGYYNNKLAVWEPLIEPEVVNEYTHIPWELKVEVIFNEITESISGTTLNLSEFEFEKEVDIPKPVMSVGLYSDRNLEITVSKTLLEMVEYLTKAFEAALDTENVKATEYAAPYRVINELGEDITLILEESTFTDVGMPLGDVNKSAVPLQLKPQFKEDSKLNLGKELLGNSRKDPYCLKIQIQRLDSSLILPVVRADKRFFPLNYRSSIHDSWGIISDITVEDAITNIVLRSMVQVHNHFDNPIDVYYMTAKGNQLELISKVKSGEKLNVPLKAVYTPTTELFFGIEDYSVTATAFAWKDLETNLKVVRNLHCYPKHKARENIPFIIAAVGEMEQVYFEQTTRHTMSSTCYNIHLRPAVTFKNSLPVTVICCVDESPDEFTVEPGDRLQLPTVDPGTNFLVIRIPQYLEKEWSCGHKIVKEPNEFSVWTFNSYDSASKLSLELGMHIVRKKAFVLTLYCPFWMINKTSLLLGYRKSKKADKESSSPQSSDDVNVLYHPADYEGPILFSFSAKHFFGKKKASIRVENGEWSNKFSIDVAGSSGTVECKWNDQIYRIGVQNNLTFNGLTKQITFTPYYIIINEAPFLIECQENSRPADPWVVVKPKSCSPIWPKNDQQDKLLKVRVRGTTETSAPFLFTESHNTLLKLSNKFGGISVDIQTNEGGVLINIAPYEDGSAPALLLNHSNYVISYWEKDSIQKRLLEPGHSILYTWENPSGPRILVWDRGNKKEISNDLRKDMSGHFSPNDGVQIYWASFLDGMQRIILFTHDTLLAGAAQGSNYMEQIQQEIILSIQGIGISLVNNTIKREIMYIAIASSGVIWELAKPNSERYKYFDPKTSDLLEANFQECVRNSQINPKQNWQIAVDSKTEVDFKENLMVRPYKRKIRRSFLTGLWLQMKTSPSQKQIHLKINRLQIDNQMYDCIFPVFLAPVPIPKSVAGGTLKPFIEVSIVQLLLKNSQILQFKYFKVLVQEFHIKVDLGFVNALLEMFAEEEASHEKQKQQFLLDVNHVQESLYALASTQSLEQQKSFYDLLHFSPFKIHISFSLATVGSEHINAPPILNVLLQGIGVTLTDMNDVVFKLAFFERNYTFLTQNQLISEATAHYVGQAIKQFYVLVLGLDVLGNPYGLVLGITKGVEDLFYEPFQGAIQGPGEFVEGLTIGVKSLFGHTVGGAAGAVSKITGAMGKGIAALTFDDDFQRKRREHKSRKPTNVQEGLARSGKGVVMGFYSGVTGVFTKPVEGAKEQGVEGFFKGLGKGAMGLVTRPVSGVVDFASESFDVVKRAAEGDEDTFKLRNPRFIHPDGQLRPYDKAEAEGNSYLHNLSKGKYAKTDVYVAHYHIIQGKEILLLTNQRIAYITYSDMFGGWQIEWAYTWDEISAPPKVGPKGVLIQTSHKKKAMFGSSDASKVVLMGNPKTREEICQKIESLRII